MTYLQIVCLIVYVVLIETTIGLVTVRGALEPGDRRRYNAPIAALGLALSVTAIAFLFLRGST